MNPGGACRYDLELLAAARDGNEQALLTLLEAAQPDIRRYAARSCRLTDDVDDAVQETLWLLYRRVGALRALGSLSAWLMAVVRRECLRLARRALGRDHAAAPLELEPFADHPRLTHRPPHELRIDLARAIQSLPEHYRDVVLLRDVEELSVDELAARLGLTRESAKARLHRARTLLREYLRD